MRRQSGLVSIALIALTCSDKKPPAEPAFEAPELGLALPKLSGWVVDPEAFKAKKPPQERDGRVSIWMAGDPAKGGLVFRLVREGRVAMSPRIDVLVEPAKPRPTLLEDFVTQNLRSMAKHEAEGSIRLTQVDQRPASVGPRRGYRIRHEYTMSAGQGAPIAITQVSTLLILDGRGVAVTAAGRTELFHPLASSIERIMAGIWTPMPKGRATPTQVVAPVEPKDEAAPPPSAIQPIDLGKIGGE